MEKQSKTSQKTEPVVVEKILTIPNAISVIRLCLVPVFFALLLDGYNIFATFVYALAAGTDWIDGQIARRTHQVSKLGQLLDPTVDRILMISGVVGLFITGRLPLWIILIVVTRDLFLLLGGAYILRRHRIRIPVIFPGKVATTLLYVGFAGLLLNMPLVSGLGITAFSWLPGFNAEPCSWGIWFIYIGLIISLATAAYYTYAGLKKLSVTRTQS